jgi:hypothetical protein
MRTRRTAPLAVAIAVREPTDDEPNQAIRRIAVKVCPVRADI